MGALKLEQRKKVEYDREHGSEIQEVGEQKIKEAEAFAQPMIWGIETIDDDEKSFLDAVQSEFDRYRHKELKATVESPGNDDDPSRKKDDLSTVKSSDCDFLTFQDASDEANRIDEDKQTTMEQLKIYLKDIF